MWRGEFHSAQVSTEWEEKFALNTDGSEGSLKVGSKAETGFVSQKDPSGKSEGQEQSQEVCLRGC